MRGPDAKRGLVGRRVSIEVEAGDARQGVFDKLSGTIASLEEIGAGQFALVVTLEPSVTLTSGLVVSEILVGSEERDILSKLSGSEHSQLGIPLSIAMWRIENRMDVERVRATHKPPPATAYLGRAELALVPRIDDN